MKQKLVQTVPRCHQTARSLIQLHRRDPSNWLTYQHLNFLKRQVTAVKSDIFHLNLHPVELIFTNHLVLLFSSQYVAKNNSELHQRAVPKRAPVLTIIDERDDSVERQVQRIPTLGPDPQTDPASQPDDVASEAQPEASTVKHTSQDVASQKDPVSTTGLVPDETPHVHVETDEAREARLDRQWKQLKVDVVDLPDVYARLAKIKLTGRLQSTDARSET